MFLLKFVFWKVSQRSQTFLPCILNMREPMWQWGQGYCSAAVGRVRCCQFNFFTYQEESINEAKIQIVADNKAVFSVKAVTWWKSFSVESAKSEVAFFCQKILIDLAVKYGFMVVFFFQLEFSM